MAQSQEQSELRSIAGRRDFVHLSVPLSPDVVRFCLQNNLSEEVSKAVSLANDAFPNVSLIVAELEIDPDSDAERLLLLVTTRGSVEEIVRAKKTFTTKWIAVASDAVSEKLGLLYVFE